MLINIEINSVSENYHIRSIIHPMFEEIAETVDYFVVNSLINYLIDHNFEGTPWDIYLHIRKYTYKELEEAYLIPALENVMDYMRETYSNVWIEYLINEDKYIVLDFEN